MSNKKISALSSATTPLTGSEIVPINQSSVTDSVSVANLTAGRSVSASDYVMSTGNLVPSTAAKGINFTANTPVAGMTSQLLNWYEEGTFTPGQGSNLTVVGAFSSSGSYTRVGRLVSVVGYVKGATSVSFLGGGVQIITGLPFSAASTQLETLTLVNGGFSASSSGFVYLSTIASVTAMAATPTIYFSATYHV